MNNDLHFCPILFTYMIDKNNFWSNSIFRLFKYFVSFRQKTKNNYKLTLPDKTEYDFFMQESGEKLLIGTRTIKCFHMYILMQRDICNGRLTSVVEDSVQH